MIKIAFIDYVASKLPELPEQLKKAGIHDSPEEFVKKSLLSGVYGGIGITFILFLLLAKYVTTKMLILTLLIALPISMAVLFLYFLQIPMVKIKKIDREINKEIIYAGRFLVVELESGITLYEAMKNLVKSYPVTGAYFADIINRINIGTSMEEAIKEGINLSPSSSLTKIFWQISNSLRTGSNVAAPLSTVVETLIKEQQIAVNEYGRKLNPLAMFYMMMAIIMPTLGVTMLTIISIFIGFKIDLSILLVIAGLIGFLQFMFVAMINSIRPPVEL